ncbi:MAG: SDR family oxidoreductase [Cyanobacteria bacterium J06598_3]
MVDRENQHSIVTGGSSGIGKAIALQLAREGADVSILARGEARLQQAKEEIEQVRRSERQRVLALSVDVSDRVQVMETIGEAIAQLGPPAQLITSAGIAHPGHFQDLSAEVFEQAMAVNYFGTLYCIQAVLPFMEKQPVEKQPVEKQQIERPQVKKQQTKKQQTGQICLLSSGAALIGLYGYSAYGASKFAVRGLAESLRAELKPVGIQVSVAYPPDTETPQLAAESRTKPAATKEITATAKLWQADDVAQAILQGMARGRFELSLGLEIGVLTRLHSVISPVLNRYFDEIVARFPR